MVISSADCPPFCSNSAVIPSGPGALFLGILASSNLRMVLLGGGPIVFADCRLGGAQDWYMFCQNAINSLTYGPVSSRCFYPLLIMLLLIFLVMVHISSGVARICSTLRCSLVVW